MDFLDVDVETDVKLFVDPLLLPANLEKIIFDFIQTVYDKYSSGQKNEALGLFVYSKECNATHIGYSSGKSRGTGVSKEMLDQFFTYVMKATDRLKEKLLTPVSLPLFIKKFSKDRMSDLLISILKKELILFSLDQAKIHNLPISSRKAKFEFWNIEKHQWDVFESYYVLDYVGKELILLPKTIVNRRFEVTPAKYISVIFSHLQTKEAYQDPDGSPFTKKKLRQLEISDSYKFNKEKEYILDTTGALPELFEEFYEQSLRFRSFKSLTDEQLIEQLTKDS
ncbi:hypothetical protein ABID29_002144 [Streptococcus rupicaprae]|uniref:Uncharacterized protein n=1 Tax=Streptococcus rupicaprae TaxID=759619 RepID=A0ABV2FKM0_9STRE